MAVDPHDLLAVTLVDLRANLEAKQRALDATEACVHEFRSTRDADALTEAARHLGVIKALHATIGETVDTAHLTLLSLLSPGPSSVAVAFFGCIVHARVFHI